MTSQTTPTDRPLTAGDVPLLREGDVLRSHRKRHFVRCVAAGVIVLEYAAFTAAEFEAARFTFVSRQKVDGGLPDIEAEGERIVRDTYKREGDFGYLWTDVVGAVQTAISEERARHPARPATSAASEGEGDLALDLAAMREPDAGLFPLRPGRRFLDLAADIEAALASPPVSERERELTKKMDAVGAVVANFGTNEQHAAWLDLVRTLTAQPAGEGK